MSFKKKQRKASLGTDDTSNDADDVFSFPVDTEEDRAALISSKKKMSKKKSGGFQSMNLLPAL